MFLYYTTAVSESTTTHVQLVSFLGSILINPNLLHHMCSHLPQPVQVSSLLLQAFLWLFLLHLLHHPLFLSLPLSPLLVKIHPLFLPLHLSPLLHHSLFLSLPLSSLIPDQSGVWSGIGAGVGVALLLALLAVVVLVALLCVRRRRTLKVSLQHQMTIVGNPVYEGK